VVCSGWNAKPATSREREVSALSPLRGGAHHKTSSSRLFASFAFQHAEHCCAAQSGGEQWHTVSRIHTRNTAPSFFPSRIDTPTSVAVKSAMPHSPMPLAIATPSPRRSVKP